MHFVDNEPRIAPGQDDTACLCPAAVRQRHSAWSWSGPRCYQRRSWPSAVCWPAADRRKCPGAGFRRTWPGPRRGAAPGAASARGRPVASWPDSSPVRPPTAWFCPDTHRFGTRTGRNNSRNSTGRAV